MITQTEDSSRCFALSRLFCWAPNRTKEDDGETWMEPVPKKRSKKSRVSARYKPSRARGPRFVPPVPAAPSPDGAAVAGKGGIARSASWPNALESLDQVDQCDVGYIGDVVVRELENIDDVAGDKKVELSASIRSAPSSNLLESLYQEDLRELTNIDVIAEDKKAQPSVNSFDPNEGRAIFHKKSSSLEETSSMGSFFLDDSVDSIDTSLDHSDRSKNESESESENGIKTTLSSLTMVTGRLFCWAPNRTKEDDGETWMEPVPKKRSKKSRVSARYKPSRARGPRFIPPVPAAPSPDGTAVAGKEGIAKSASWPNLLENLDQVDHCDVGYIGDVVVRELENTDDVAGDKKVQLSASIRSAPSSNVLESLDQVDLRELRNNIDVAKDKKVQPLVNSFDPNEGRAIFDKRSSSLEDTSSMRSFFSEDSVKSSDASLDDSDGSKDESESESEDGTETTLSSLTMVTG